MKKMNRKGFTIVELVIVIAVIAILAGVMIPTFSGIVNKAKDSAALQEATNAYKEAYGIALSDGVITTADNTATADINGFKFVWTNDGACTVTVPNKYTGYTFTVTDNQIKMTASPNN